MAKFKLIVLLTCHENKESIKNTIENIFKFNEDTCVILNDGTDENLEDIKMPNLFIKKRIVRYDRFDTMIPLHIELKDVIIENNIQSDYVLLMSSNQLFIKHDLYDFIKNYEASYYSRDIDRGCIGTLERYEIFRKYQNDIGKENFLHQSNHDGMFFKFNIFMEMMNYFDNFRNQKIDTHAEEFLYCAYLKKNHPNQLAKFDNYNYWQPDWRKNLNPIKPDELKRCLEKQYYIIKRVSRDIEDETRKIITEME
jgi:hypothetical protein